MTGKLKVWLLTLSLAALACTADDSTKTLLAIKDQIFAEKKAEVAAGRALADAGVRLGNWHRIGPFRDRGPLINWMDNVEYAFLHTYPVEEEALANGGLPFLSKKYAAPNFPSKPKAERQWTQHAAWINGYYQQFPREAAPAAGETTFVYLEITAAKPVFADKTDPDYRKILSLLKHVVHRKEPGVKDLLEAAGDQASVLPPGH